MKRFVVKYEDALGWLDSAVDKKRTNGSDWAMARSQHDDRVGNGLFGHGITFGSVILLGK